VKFNYSFTTTVPGVRGKVPRAKKIKYSGLNTEGEYFERIAEGWHARIFQHEFDHLNGILYTGLLYL
jgi:peptide deformylase